MACRIRAISSRCQLKHWAQQRRCKAAVSKPSPSSDPTPNPTKRLPGALVLRTSNFLMQGMGVPGRNEPPRQGATLNYKSGTYTSTRSSTPLQADAAPSATHQGQAHTTTTPSSTKRLPGAMVLRTSSFLMEGLGVPGRNQSAKQGAALNYKSGTYTATPSTPSKATAIESTPMSAPTSKLSPTDPSPAPVREASQGATFNYKSCTYTPTPSTTTMTAPMPTDSIPMSAPTPTPSPTDPRLTLAREASQGATVNYKSATYTLSPGATFNYKSYTYTPTPSTTTMSAPMPTDSIPMSAPTPTPSPIDPRPILAREASQGATLNYKSATYTLSPSATTAAPKPTDSPLISTPTPTQSPITRTPITTTAIETKPTDSIQVSAPTPAPISAPSSKGLGPTLIMEAPQGAILNYKAATYTLSPRATTITASATYTVSTRATTSPTDPGPALVRQASQSATLNYKSATYTLSPSKTTVKSTPVASPSPTLEPASEASPKLQPEETYIKPPEPKSEPTPTLAEKPKPQKATPQPSPPQAQSPSKSGLAMLGVFALLSITFLLMNSTQKSQVAERPGDVKAKKVASVSSTMQKKTGSKIEEALESIEQQSIDKAPSDCTDAELSPTAQAHIEKVVERLALLRDADQKLMVIDKLISVYEDPASALVAQFTESDASICRRRLREYRDALLSQ